MYVCAIPISILNEVCKEIYVRGYHKCSRYYMSLEQRRKEGGEGKPAGGPGAAAPRPQPAHKPKDKDDKPKEEVKVCDTGLSNTFIDIGSLHTSFSLKKNNC